jgi:hypothetical protein
MNIEAFLLCDAATDQMGKLNILGAFDHIVAAKMPTKHPACAIAGRIRFERIEEGEHKIRVQIIDEDARPLGPKMDGNINIRFTSDVDSAVNNFVLNIQGLQFEKYGKYRIDLAIDGQIRGSLPFYVMELPGQRE